MTCDHGFKMHCRVCSVEVGHQMVQHAATVAFNDHAGIVETILSEGHLLVVRIAQDEGRDERTVTWLASTHWGQHGVLRLHRRANGDTAFSWPSSHIRDEATAVQVARVMHKVWEDACNVLTAWIEFDEEEEA